MKAFPISARLTHPRQSQRTRTKRTIPRPRRPPWVRLALRLLFVVLPATGLLRAAEAKPLLLLGDRDYPPMAYLEDGTAKGLDVDLARALAPHLKREVQIELMDWNLAQQRVLSGEADGLIGMSVSEERRKQYDFASPMFTREFGLLVRDGELAIHGPSDITGKQVGVTPGGFPKRFLEAQTGVRLVLITNYQDGFDRLTAGTIDAVAVDLWVAAFLAEKGRVKGITVAGRPFATAEAAIAVKKGNPNLLAEINRAVAALQAAGTIAAIREHWRPQEMLFLSRERMSSLIRLAVGGALLILIVVLLVWILTLQRQIRIRRGAEAALRESEERYSLAVRGSTDGLWDWNVLTNAVFYSDRFRELLGFTGVEFPNLFASFESHLHPDDRERVLDAVRAHLERRVPYDIEYRLRTKSGEHRWFRARGQAVWDATNSATRMAGSITDITERKRVEDALRESEEKFATAFHANPNAAVITRLRDGLIVEANDQFLRRYGLTHAKAIGRPARELGVWRTDAERQALLDQLQAQGSIRDFEKETLLPSGKRSTSLLSVERIVLHGEACMLTVSRDITERKRAEEALAKSEEKFSKAFRTSPDSISISELDTGRYIEVNDGFCRCYGYAREEIIGRSSLEMGIWQPPQREQYVARLRRDGSVRDYELHTHSRTGRPLVVLVSAELIELDGVVCVVAVGHDITDRQQAESERAAALQREQQAHAEFTRQLLNAQERERKRIASELHDSLGQNLSIIKNRLHFTAQVPGLPAAAAAHLEAMERIMAEAIAETRSLARNLRPLHIEQVGLTDSLRGLVQEVSQSTEIRFERRVEPVDEVLRGDAATHVFRIVQEALNNLIKHSHATQAGLTVERDIRSVRVCIRDDGVGFDVNRRGGGLGLTSLEERIRMLGGTMRIESAPGRGTQLTFDIPIVEPQE